MEITFTLFHFFSSLQEQETEKVKNYENKKKNELKRLDTMIVSTVLNELWYTCAMHSCFCVLIHIKMIFSLRLVHCQTHTHFGNKHLTFNEISNLFMWVG